MIMSVQFLRFVAAMAVVGYHSFIYLMWKSGANWPDMAWALVASGKFVVDIFFVISGFVMMHTMRGYFSRPGAPCNFWKRRAIRIYPIYWICLAIYLVVFAMLDLRDINFRDLPLATILWPGKASLIIEQGWTLAYEVYFYLCFGLALVLSRHAGLLLLFGFFLSSIALGRLLPGESQVVTVITNVLLVEFLAGIFLALAYANGWLAAFAHHRWLVAAGWIVAVIAYLGGTFSSATGLPQTLFFGPAAALGIGLVLGAEGAGRLPRFIKCGAWLGDSSYSLYLIHILPILVLTPILSGMISNIGVLIFFSVGLMLLSFMTGLAVHYWIERPVLSLLRPNARS